MEKQRCAQCGEEFRVVKSWQRFCTPQCRDAWHYEQWKREQVKDAEAELAAKKQLPELRKKFDAMQIVQALKSGRPLAAPAVAESNGLRRRAM
jgi:hypothetical protein